MRRHRLQQRLAAWADSRLLPAGTMALLLIDVAAGLNWATSPESALTSPAYRVAKQLLTMDAYGVLFIAAALVSTVVYLHLGRSWATGYFVGGATAGLWAFWAVVLTLGPMGTRGASYAGSVFAVGLCLLHLLFGLALTHRPQESASPDGS